MALRTSLVTLALVVTAACSAPRSTTGPAPSDDAAPVDAPTIDTPATPDVATPDVTAPDVVAPDVVATDITVDVTPACPGDQTRCNGACVDTRTANNHCGACGRTCAATERCAAGACAAIPTDCRMGPCPAGSYCNLGDGMCLSGCLNNAECPQPGTCDGVTHACRCAAATHRCGSACVSDTSAATCGSACSPCPTVANGTPTCSSGVCGIACNPGYHRCGDACVSDASTDQCGASCMRCPTPPPNGAAACVGACVVQCNAGYHFCGGACVPDDSVTQCGAACAACPTPSNGAPVCASGACAVTCGAGYHACGLTCASDASATQCGAACTPCTVAPLHGRPACTAGACDFVCDAGYTRCGSECVDTARDAAHCGACRNGCAPGASCVTGVCTCPMAGGITCGGRCVDGQNDRNNCGVCGRVCATALSCVRGACTCPDSAPSLCGGVCVNTTFNSAHCGACGNACTGGATCSGGVCACTTAGQVNCGGTCVDLQTSAANCGACGNACPVACSAGRCVTVSNIVVRSGSTFLLMSDGAFFVRSSLPGIRVLPVPAGTTRYVPGGGGQCVLLASGAVWCEGDSSWGQLGDGTQGSTRTGFAPTSGLTDAVDLVGRAYYYCALRRSGAVSCWGQDDAGQLGFTAGRCGPGRLEPCATRPTESSAFFGARQVAVASYVTCVLTAAGAVGCTNTGPGTDRSVLTIMVPSGAVAIGAGTDARCVVMTDGTVRCWGDNTVGQLGDGTTTARTTPVTVPGITTAVDIVAGPRHTCVRLMDGTVRCWGENLSGQLGDGTTTNRTSPVTVSGLTDVDMFARDSYAAHVCARRTDGSVWCWGYNTFYGLGDGTNVMRTRPVRMQF